MTACADGVPLRQCFDGNAHALPQLRWMKVAVDWYRASLREKQRSGV
jgi:hypothetical protein